PAPYPSNAPLPTTGSPPAHCRVNHRAGAAAPDVSGARTHFAGPATPLWFFCPWPKAWGRRGVPPTDGRRCREYVGEGGQGKGGLGSSPGQRHDVLDVVPQAKAACGREGLRALGPAWDGSEP